MRLQWIVETSGDGRVDVTELTQQYYVKTRMPGGFWSARVTLQEHAWRAWRFLETWPGGTLSLIAGPDTVWTGSLAAAEVNRNTVVLSAEGEGVQALRDLECWRVYADADYAYWDPQDDDAFDTDNNNRVWVASRQSVTYAIGDEATVVYPESGVVLGANIVRLEATAVLTVTSGAWIAEIRNAAGTVLWSQTMTGTYAVALSFAGTTQLTVALRKTTAAGAGSASVRLTAVVVRTLYPTASDQVLAAELTTAGIAQDDVQATGITMDRAVWQGQEPLRVLESTAFLGNGSASWIGVIYENGAILRPWATSPDWTLTPRELDAWRVRIARSDVFNAVRVELPDGWRSSWSTHAASIATYGRREKTLRVPMTTQTEAAAWAALYLADHAEPVSSLELEVTTQASKSMGEIWPAYMIRAGDVVRLRDISPYTDQNIRVMETAFDGNAVRIVPMGAINRLEVLLAREELYR